MSSIVMIGPFSEKFKELGVEIYSDLHSARHHLEKNQPDVLAMSLTAIRESKFKRLWSEILNNKKHTQLILISPPDYRTQDILKIHQEFSLFRWRTSFEDAALSHDLAQAFERAKLLQQDEELKKLLDQQNKNLLKLQRELEFRIEKRTKYLTESRRKLFVMNSRIEVFHQLLLRLETIQEFDQIESVLNQSLIAPFQIQWVKLLLSPKDEIFLQEINLELNYETLRVPLYHFEEPMGSLFFMKSKPALFSEEEADFLTQVSEAISLAIERIQKEQEMLSLTQQWDSTFAAVSDPILLINDRYEIIQSNINGSKDKNPVCYELLFQRKTPCEHCSRGENFVLQNQKETFQVSSQKILIDEQSLFLNLYHNKSEELRVEAQILESARSAELGTISSSMAHELNNPLGGLITFLQMIKMDIKPDHPIFQDILEMENGAQRCKEIIQNLLVYSRQSKPEEKIIFQSKDLVSSVLKIIEIQVKSIGSKMIPDLVEDFPVQGNFNYISQALRNIIQVALDSQSKNKELFISLKREMARDCIDIQVSAVLNVKQIKNMNFSWTLAEQILLDQNAKIEILTSPQAGSRLKIIFPRLVLRS